MTLLSLLQNPIETVVFLLAVALAIGVHEASHATVADRLGDPTAKLMGRTSINPLVHLDPIGTLLFLLAGFGWGKPVPVDEHRLRRESDVVLVALAGPVSNLLIAILLGLVYRLVASASLHDVLSIFIVINLSLMLFNLIPIPPLDGSKLLRLVAPREIYAMLEQYGFLLVLVLFFLLQSSGLGTLLTNGVARLFTLVTGASF